MAESTTVQMPAPVGGINEALPDFGLPPQYAVRCVNLIPYGGVMCPRQPFAVRITSTSIAELPRWMYTYSGPSGDQLVILTEDGTGFILNPDLTLADATSGVDGVEQSVGFNFDGKIAYTAYPTTGPLQYEPVGGGGSISFTMPAIGEWSAATPEQITGGHPFKSRVYWWSEDFRSMTYTAVNAIGGQLEYFPLSTVAQTGGTVRCITSLTMDGGSGPDDYLAIVLTTGEVILYQGSDPGASNDWSLVGRFMVPPPIHAGAVTRVGGDMLMLTPQGLIPLQQYAKAALGQIKVDWLDAINPVIRSEFNDSRVPGVLIGKFGNISYLPYRRWLVAITGPLPAPLQIPSLEESMFGSCYVFVPDASAWTSLEINQTDPSTEAGNEYLSVPKLRYGILAMAEANGKVYAIIRTKDDDETDRPRLVEYILEDGIPVSNDPGDLPIRCGWTRGNLPLEPDATVSEAEITWAKNPDDGTDILRWYYRVSIDFKPSEIKWESSGNDADDSNVSAHRFSVNGIGSSFQETIIFDVKYTKLSTERAVRLYKSELRIEGFKR